MMPIALTIAGSDPTSGAGLQADLQTYRDFHVAGRSVAAAITAQTEERVLALWPTPADVLTQQLATAAADVELRAAKVGLLASAANVWAVVWFLRSRHIPNVVIDPLLHSSSGFTLLDPQAIPIYRQHLLPLANVVAPNLAEATALAGMQVASLEGMEKAAQAIHTELHRLRGGGDKPLAVIVKGGHMRSEAVDVCFDGTDLHHIEGIRVAGSIHGSGCRYSAAVAAELAKGTPVVEAARSAKQYVTKLITERLALASA
ncbi:MAG: bifunctional hydroxymethylpyrimidine kinase/phosphomethylpyrimidine kinase [Deltaproteobacteria bacterium]|nr:bifunctional hydroxymethylpyrimidine kinase/phosphomethylpyrimidine kinase [Deltaproteobacteria bacterium]